MLIRFDKESQLFPDRLKLDKREGRKAAAEKYEPTRGHFPGADFPLAVAQIDHTPMDVIGGKHRDSLLPAAAAARPKRLRCTVADQH
jgi:hypothetical protein